MNIGVGENDVLQASASISDNDFLRVNVDKIEGLSDSEMRTALGLVKGISSGNVFEASGSVADNDFLKVNGGAVVEGRSASEVLADINAQPLNDMLVIFWFNSGCCKGVYFPSNNTAATFDLTEAGRNLLDDANASAQRTTLGLAIGSDVQAYDADLDTLSGMQSGAPAALALLTSAEFAESDGASVANSTASKAVVLDSSGDLTISGSLQVNGSLTYVNTTNLKVTDALVTFASGTTFSALDVVSKLVKVLLLKVT